MSIPNLDLLKQSKDKIVGGLAEACKTGNEEEIKNSMEALQSFITEQVMAEAEGLVEATDRSILSARGIRQLTTEETKFYSKFIESSTQDATGVITGLPDAFPPTVIDSVMDDMQKSHPLLSLINFQNTGLATRWIINGQTAQEATWDAINTAITKEVFGKIEFVDLKLSKLTAFMYCTKDMLKLGPQWVDRYCRAVLSEALAVGLEVAIVDGDGVNKPIGMTRNHKGDFNAVTGYPRKDAISVTSFTPLAYGQLLSQLTQDELGNQRTVSEVVLIVSPIDYMTKVMPATTVLTPDAKYISNVLPFPTTVVQSVGVPANHAVIGIAKRYWAGLGSSQKGELTYSDDYKFLEDLRTYVVRLYGNGRAMDINSFLYLDITDLSTTFTTFNANINGDVTTHTGD